MVATSPTVTNSVTFKILLSASCSASSFSDFSRWESLFSRRYFAPLDFVVFPWSFSKVSRICFWISSSEGSSFCMAGRCCFCPPLFWLGFRLPGPVSFVMRFLRRLFPSPSAGFLGSGFLNCVRSIFWPVAFNPLNFLYCVSILPLASDGASSLGAAVTSGTGFSSFFSATFGSGAGGGAVSYTHLTLPTIWSV